MDCAVYKSRRRRDTYVYLPAGDDPEDLPEALRNLLGALEFVMDLELTPDRRLARADAAVVMDALRREGYYLQLPPPV